MLHEIRLVIADDHPFFRRGLLEVIKEDPSLHVVGEATDGEQALAMIQTHQPDVAVLDIDMPKLDGFAVAQAIRDKHPTVASIFLTYFKDEDIFNEALNLGAIGYVLKESATAELIDCIKAVRAGRLFISSSLSHYLHHRHQRATALEKEKPGLQQLTPTERQVLGKIAERKTNPQIASEMSISVRTVENHRSHICEKLDLHGPHALLTFALEHKSELF